jgi:hypothetical protein
MPVSVILDISDITKPKFCSSQTRFQPGHRFDVHTVSPALDRKLVYVNSESVISDCKGPLDHVTVVDISNVQKPFPVSRFPVPVPPPGLPYKNFCDKGGRFGPHHMNQLQYNPNVQKQGNLVYLTWFNAGLRVYDVTDKRLPREVGYFMAGLPEKISIPSYGNYVRMEDVFVDNRGFIYVTGGAQQGIYILRYTGPVKN